MMFHDFNYEATLATSLRAAWQLDDVLREDQELNFSRNMMPESLARTAALEMLTPDEQRTLNQISAHQYLSIFGIVEEFILPFLMDHARSALPKVCGIYPPIFPSHRSADPLIARRATQFHGEPGSGVDYKRRVQSWR